MTEEADAPPLWTRGKAASSAIEWFGRSSPEYELAADVIRIEMFDQIERSYSIGIQCYISSNLGGLDYPCNYAQAWDRANRLTRNLLEGIANYEPAELNLPLIQLLAEQSALFTMRVGGNPWAIQDRHTMSTIMEELQIRGGLATRLDLALASGTDVASFPATFFSKYRKPFKPPGLESRWLTFPLAFKEAQNRIIANRGIVPPDRRIFIDSDREMGIRYSENAVSILEILEGLRPTRLQGSGITGGDLVEAAEAAADEATKRVFVNMDILESVLPDRVIRMSLRL
jgi:hypothetical protein